MNAVLTNYKNQVCKCKQFVNKKILRNFQKTLDKIEKV